MKRSSFRLTIVTLFLMFTLLYPASAARAQGSNYTMRKWTAASGGGNSSFIRFSLTGTIGQAIAGSPARGGRFQVDSGFWSGLRSSPPEIYLPVIVNPPRERPFPGDGQISELLNHTNPGDAPTEADSH